MKTIRKIQSLPDTECESPVIRTFLVDDDPALLALLAKLLAREPRITIVGSTADARKAFHAAALSCADLVLTDLHMPMVDGLEVTRMLKQLRNPPVVFVVTSDDTPEAMTRCLSAGADAFIAKAADLQIQLRMAIQNSFPAERDKDNPDSNRTYELLAATWPG